MRVVLTAQTKRHERETAEGAVDDGGQGTSRYGTGTVELSVDLIAEPIALDGLYRVVPYRVRQSNRSVLRR